VLWACDHRLMVHVARQLTIHPHAERDLVLLNTMFLKTLKLKHSTEEMRLANMSVEELM